MDFEQILMIFINFVVVFSVLVLLAIFIDILKRPSRACAYGASDVTNSTVESVVVPTDKTKKNKTKKDKNNASKAKTTSTNSKVVGGTVVGVVGGNSVVSSKNKKPCSYKNRKPLKPCHGMKASYANSCNCAK